MSDLDDDLTQRDRDKLEALRDDADDSWDRAGLLELDLDGKPPGRELVDERTLSGYMPMPPEHQVAAYRQLLLQMEEALAASGAAVADLRTRECDHKHVVISQQTAEIRCRVCGGEVDVWWWVRRIATEWGRAEHAYQWAQEETRKLCAQVVDLKREVANLSAQVKRRGGDPQAVRSKRR